MQVQQRRKDALLQTGDEGAASAESSLQQLVSRYHYLDLWPCSAQDLDYLARQQVYFCFLVLHVWPAVEVMCATIKIKNSATKYIGFHICSSMQRYPSDKATKISILLTKVASLQKYCLQGRQLFSWGFQFRKWQVRHISYNSAGYLYRVQ